MMRKRNTIVIKYKAYIPTRAKFNTILNPTYNKFDPMNARLNPTPQKNFLTLNNSPTAAIVVLGAIPIAASFKNNASISTSVIPNEEKENAFNRFAAVANGPS